jgi:uncharacterized protein (TIGR03435 family)
MQRNDKLLGWRRKLFLNASGLMTFAAPIILTLVWATQRRALLDAQGVAAASPVYTYEVVSIKLSKPGNGIRMRIGITNTPDGLTAENATLQSVITSAFGVLDFQVSGGPDWLSTERYDIEAKMEASVADVLQKLRPDERRLARQKMLQALLVDRFKLAIHRGAKELPVYALVITKTGPKLQEAKPGDTYPKGFKTADGCAGAGMMMIGESLGANTMTAQGVTIASLVDTLSASLGRPVLDKTGLTGRYDFRLTWAPDENQTDSSAPSLFTAIQEQLGLKLESGRGPVPTIVIDHIERPSGN